MTDIVERLRDRVHPEYATTVIVSDTLREAAAEIERLRAKIERWQAQSIAQYAEIERLQNGNRPLPFDRDELGRMVREAWVRWAHTQTNPKASWLVPYDKLSEPDKEADRQIGEAIARFTLIGDAARRALEDKP